MVPRQDQFHEVLLRSLALSDEKFIESTLGIRLENAEASVLDPKTSALVRLGALLAVDAATPTYQWIVGVAVASGATLEEIAGAVIAVAPTIGVARIVSAAPKLGLAVGYDIDTALERLDDEDGSTAQPTSTRQGVSHHDAE